MAEQSLPPSWIRWVATNNPVTRAAQAGRSAAFSEADWGPVTSPAGLLVLRLLAGAAFPTRAFNSYQPSI